MWRTKTPNSWIWHSVLILDRWYGILPRIMETGGLGEHSCILAKKLKRTLFNPRLHFTVPYVDNACISIPSPAIAICTTSFRQDTSSARNHPKARLIHSMQTSSTYTHCTRSHDKRGANGGCEWDGVTKCDWVFGHIPGYVLHLHFQWKKDWANLQ